MTFDEYAGEIGRRLRDAHNSKDQAEALRIFDAADAALVASKAGSIQQKMFWLKVNTEFFSGRFAVEEQDNSSLHVLMQLIQKNLAKRGVV